MLEIDDNKKIGILLRVDTDRYGLVRVGTNIFEIEPY